MSFAESENGPRYADYHRSHASIQHRTSFDYELSSPAPISEGLASGYFDDEATRSLLALEEADQVMHSGTYGPKEPGGEPIELSLLREGTYDQRILPFVPQCFMSFFSLELYEKNGQAYPRTAIVDSLMSSLQEALAEAQTLGGKVGLSLPHYVRRILPRLLYRRDVSATPFALQLQPYFTPSALRIRWVRLNRVLALIHAFINLCHRVLHPEANWRYTCT